MSIRTTVAMSVALATVAAVSVPWLSARAAVADQVPSTQAATGQNPAQRGDRVVQDERFDWSIRIPADWQTKRMPADSAFVRLISTSLRSDVSLDVYAGELSRGTVNVVGLAKSGKKLFKFLGDEVSSRWLADEKLEVLYNRNNRYREQARATYVARGSRYFVLIAYSRKGDLTEATELVNSFNVSSRFLETTYGKVSLWLGGALAVIGLIILGRTLLHIVTAIKNARTTLNSIDSKAGQYDLLLETIRKENPAATAERVKELVTRVKVWTAGDLRRSYWKMAGSIVALVLINAVAVSCVRSDVSSWRLVLGFVGELGCLTVGYTDTVGLSLQVIFGIFDEA